jgi:hypothetical protein
VDRARDHSQPRINKRRLQFVVSGILAAVGVVYGLYVLVPAYKSFSDDFFDRQAWKAAGWDDPDVRRKAIDRCMAGVAEQPFTSVEPREELEQRERECTRPGFNPWKSAPPRWETPVAFIDSTLPSMVAYVAGAVLVGPWLVGYLLVDLLPAGVARLWRWLRTPDPTS